MLRVLLAAALLLAGCASGAVSFAPTAPPPDTSPARWEHPGGVFALRLPPTWAVYSQNTTVLASAAFSPPGAHTPALTVAVINLGDRLDTQAFAALLDDYQTRLHGGAGAYTGQSEQAMGDGSWRLTGVRALPGGATQPVNTFIQQTGPLLAVIETDVSGSPQQLAELQRIVNTVQINPQAALEPSAPDVLTAATPAMFEVTRIHTWNTPAGVFYITGEIANRGAAQAVDLPVRAVLYTADGLGVAEAVDTVMGLAIPPGGFMPFSLRFGQGQPALTTRFSVEVGGADWEPSDAPAVYGPGNLDWIDESRFDDLGRLIVSGVVTNIGSEPVGGLRAVVTVSDAANRVIAAGFSDIDAPPLEPNESTLFEVIVPEMGGEPQEYSVTIQGVRP